MSRVCTPSYKQHFPWAEGVTVYKKAVLSDLIKWKLFFPPQIWIITPWFFYFVSSNWGCIIWQKRFYQFDRPLCSMYLGHIPFSLQKESCEFSHKKKVFSSKSGELVPTHPVKLHLAWSVVNSRLPIAIFFYPHFTQQLTNCYGLNVCVTLKFICWNSNSQCNSIRRWGLWGD